MSRINGSSEDTVVGYISPSDWESQFMTRPVDASCYTQITCIHTVHGTKTFYLSVGEFQDNIRALLSPYWINNFTIVLQPML